MLENSKLQNTHMSLTWEATAEAPAGLKTDRPNFFRTSEVRKVKEKMRKGYITMESQQKN